MGVSSSNLNDPHSELETQLFRLLRHRQQITIPLLPTSRYDNIEYIPTCSPSCMQDFPRSAVMPYEMASMGGVGGMNGMQNFMPHHRPRYEAAPGYRGVYPGHGHDYETIVCGHCHDMAHPGPCRFEREANPDWSRPRAMRGGGVGMPSDFWDNLGEWLRNNNRANVVGGCGPNCTTNDGSFRVRGKVDDRDVDLKLGGTPACPCADHGGCDATRRRAQSCSRSRRRRDRRDARKARRRETEPDAASSDGESERGRKKKREASRETTEGFHDLKARLKSLTDDVQRFYNQVAQVRDLLANLPTDPECLPDARPYFGPESRSRGPGLGAMPSRRPPWPHGMNHDLMMGDGVPPREYSLGRMARQPLDADFDPAFERGALDIGNGLVPRRARPGMGRANADIPDDWVDIDEMDDELPLRMGGTGLRGGRGHKIRSRGFQGKRPPFGRKMTRDPFVDAAMFGGLGKAGRDDIEGEELC